jgi:hypothetical protein
MSLPAIDPTPFSLFLLSLQSCPFPLKLPLHPTKLDDDNYTYFPFLQNGSSNTLQKGVILQSVCEAPLNETTSNPRIHQKAGKRE